MLSEPRLVSASNRVDVSAALGSRSGVEQDQYKRALADDDADAVLELAAPNEQGQAVREPRRDLLFDERREFGIGDGRSIWFRRAEEELGALERVTASGTRRGRRRFNTVNRGRRAREGHDKQGGDRTTCEPDDDGNLLRVPKTSGAASPAG